MLLDWDVSHSPLYSTGLDEGILEEVMSYSSGDTKTLCETVAYTGFKAS